MIVTVTPTPAIDVTYTVDGLTVGRQVRAARVLKEASGKGINVSVALDQQGYPTRSVVAVSDDAVGEAWRALAGAYRFPVAAVEVSAGTRLNTTVKDASGTTTRVNEPVAPLTDRDVAALVAAVDAAAAGAPVPWLVCSGSVPDAAAAPLFAGLVDVARRHGARLAVDTSGPALAAAVSAGADLLKPNEHELAELVGHPVEGPADIEAATVELARGAGAVVLTTLGKAGAFVSDGEHSAWAATEEIPVANTAGAGDATLAGYLAASLTDDSLQARAVEAVRWGMAACMYEGTAGLFEAATPSVGAGHREGGHERQAPATPSPAIARLEPPRRYM